MCLHLNSLQNLMERLANPGVKMLLIVETWSKIVEGFISLGEFFQFLLSSLTSRSSKKIPIKPCPRRIGDATTLYASTVRAEKELGWNSS